MELLSSLPAMNLDTRADAIERLVRNPSPGIRSRALRVGATVLSDDRVVEYLRSEADGVLRNAGLEMLKLRAGKGFGLAVELLKDRDHDVVLQAVLALDHYKDPRALEPLRGCLDHQDMNVAQAAIVAIGHLGDARAIPDLLPFLASDPWVQLGAIQALGDLRSPAAVRPLSRLLTDMMVGPLAAEALARIGGVQACRVLAQHWLRFRDTLEVEPTVGLLAHILEGLPRSAPEIADLRASLIEVLDGENGAAVAAARAILALGPARSRATADEDARALAALAESQADPSILPSCLVKRHDLIAHMLCQQGILTAWGLLLAARFPLRTPREAIEEALRNVPPLEYLDSILKALAKLRDPGLAPAILDLYLRLPIDYRAAILPLLPPRRNQLRPFVEGSEPVAGRPLEDADRIVLQAVLGAPTGHLLEAISELDAVTQARVLSQVVDRRDVLVELPWERWLEERPDLFAPLAAEVAIAGELRDLLPLLRERLEIAPDPTLVRAVGELGDSESVATLVELLERKPSDLDAIVLESLGRVGGPTARQALREAARSSEIHRSRMAYRALSLCATRDDDTFFRQAIGHSDWFVRLSCAEVLGRFSRPENMAALAQLAADPVPIVSQRALSFLEA
jgi:HEAT repeat protein